MGGIVKIGAVAENVVTGFRSKLGLKTLVRDWWRPTLDLVAEAHMRR